MVLPDRQIRQRPYSAHTAKHRAKYSKHSFESHHDSNAAAHLHCSSHQNIISLHTRSRSTPPSSSVSQCAPPSWNHCRWILNRGNVEFIQPPDNQSFFCFPFLFLDRPAWECLQTSAYPLALEAISLRVPSQILGRRLSTSKMCNKCSSPSIDSLYLAAWPRRLILETGFDAGPRVILSFSFSGWKMKCEMRERTASGVQTTTWAASERSSATML